MKLLRDLKENQFFSDAFVLSIGTIISQAIPIAMLPVLARLFTPEDFGIFALFSAFVAILAAVASGRYELAIMLPDTDHDAEALVVTSAVMAVAFSAILFLIVIAANEKISSIIGHPHIAPFLYLVPLGVALSSIYTALNYWLNRARKFKRMSMNRVAQSALGNLSTVVFGFAQFGASSLIIGQLLGIFATTVALAFSFLKSRALQQMTGFLERGGRLVRIYRNHPAHLLPSHFVGILAMYTPTLALSFLYGPITVGFYLLAFRLVSLPASIVADAIGDVYRQRASLAYRENGEFRNLFLATVGTCAAIAIGPVLLVAEFAPDMFAVFLGEEWRVSGEYASFLVVAAYFQFVSTPADKGALIVGATRYIFIWHLLRLISFAIVFAIGYLASLTVEKVLMLFVAANIAVYMLDIVIEYRLSCNITARRAP